MKKRKTKKRNNKRRGKTLGFREGKELFSVFARYLIIILASLANFWIFYLIFTPLTVYPVFFILSLFFDVSLLNNIVLINNQIPIELIKACIAGSAYFLLLTLNLSIPKINFKKRIKMILFSFSSLLVLNVLRILLLTWVFIEGYSFFDITHKLFWYGISVIFVVGIWFTEVKLFKIKEIPFYSDIKHLYKKSLFRKSKRKPKRKLRKKH